MDSLVDLLVLLWNYGRRQTEGFHRELHLADATEEVCDEDAAGVPLEQVGTVARSGHTLALWAHLKLRHTQKNKKKNSSL